MHFHSRFAFPQTVGYGVNRCYQQTGRGGVEMTLSREFLGAVSTMIIYGQEQKANLFNYYYYGTYSFSTNPPSSVVAVLKYKGSVVANLTGYLLKVSFSQVQYLFYDTSEDMYSFDEVDIYTFYNGVLQYLVAKYTNLNYTKSSSEAVTVYFTLCLLNTPSEFVNYSFLYLLVPNLYQYNVFNFTFYSGIYSYEVQGVTGTISFIGAGLTKNGFAIFLQLETTGNGIPTIIALGGSNQKKSPLSTITQPIVFSATLNVKLPATSQPVVYPITIGLEVSQ